MFVFCLGGGGVLLFKVPYFLGDPDWDASFENYPKTLNPQPFKV